MKTIMCYQCSYFASADTEEEALNHMRIHMKNDHTPADVPTRRSGVKRSVRRSRSIPKEEREKTGATTSDGM